jgi:hypothetical protein
MQFCRRLSIQCHLSRKIKRNGIRSKRSATNMAQGIEEWYYSMPQLTRFYLTACFLSTALSSLGFVNPRSLYLSYDLIWERFQLWRLMTNFIYLGNFGFPFLMQLMILYVSFLLQYCHEWDSDRTNGTKVQLLCSFGGRSVSKWRRPHCRLRVHAFFRRFHSLGTFLSASKPMNGNACSEHTTL